MKRRIPWHTAVALLILSSPLGAATEQRGSTGTPSEVGVPVPGAASDQETTLKRRNPAKIQNPEKDAQVTLGGAQTFIEGDISRIEGTYYFVRKADAGDEMRLIVDRDTNLDCAAAPNKRDKGPAETMTSGQLSPKEEAPRASQQQLEQGQRADETARGSGFRIGNCSFEVGNRVKAEVDDNGRVTTLKYLATVAPKAPRGTGLSAGTGQLALAHEEDRPAEVDMSAGAGYPPKEYAVVPLRLGQLETVQENDLIQRPIFDVQAHKVGTLDNLLMDQATGRIEYAVILVEHTEHHLHPLPWSAIQLKARSQRREKADCRHSKIQDPSRRERQRRPGSLTGGRTDCRNNESAPPA